MSGFKGLLLSAGRCAMTYRAIFENDNDEDDVGTVDHINAAPALTYAYPIKFYNFSGMRQPRNLPLRLSKKRGPRTCMLSRCLLLMAIFLLLIHVQTTFRLSATILNDGLVGSRQSPRSLNASIHGRQRKPEMPPNATTITSNNTKQTIAYVISVTSCQRNSTNVLDGAAILGHSIHLASQRSAYDYARYAFVYKPDAADCVPQLEALGWTTKVTETLPVDVEKIQDPELQEWVNKKGCCGVKEFMKLYVYTLDDHPIAVHFDTDVLLLQPMDALFHTMLNQHQSLPDNHVMFQKQPSSTTGFYFTRDYYQGSSYTDDPSQYGVQGGFLVVKPNRTVYNELTSRLMMNETYHYARGWSNLGHTGFWGASQIQGYLSYVYEHVYPGRGIELNRVSIILHFFVVRETCKPLTTPSILTHRPSIHSAFTIP